jgi:UDP-N-acetylmuramate dehydrogenase
MTFLDELASRFGDRVRAGVPLAPYTTFRVGGPADAFLETRSSDELLAAIAIASGAGVPITLLGGGSNVLVSDRGVRGLVIHPRHGQIARQEADTVRADAAVTLNGLVRWTIGRGLAGLEAWAGTPGTVGGGIFGNAHFQGRCLGEQVARTGLATRAGEAIEVAGRDMAFAYDRSRLQTSGEILLWAEFRVEPGEPGALRTAARASLAYRKLTQPLHMPSAGCIFQNPTEGEPLPPDVPRSAGALIDRAGLKGLALGGARVSPAHANFIVNEGGATAAEIRTLIARCRREVAQRFGITLREEIVYLGEW